MAFVLNEEVKSQLNKNVNFELIEKRDRQMRFRNSQDPIYGIFDVLEQQPVSKLFCELVKDLTFEIKNTLKNITT